MPGPLKNARHEKFAQELAKGQSALGAYAAAGFRPNDGNAIRLKGNDRVSARVEELKGKAAERCIVTVEGITQRLLNIAKKGEDKDDAPLLSVARASLMDAAKLNGLVVDRAKLGFDLSDFSDEDLDALDRILGRKTSNA